MLQNRPQTTAGNVALVALLVGLVVGGGLIFRYCGRQVPKSPEVSTEASGRP